MAKGILGRKVGMTQVFDAQGRLVPVTVIEAGPCTVVQKRAVERDGYAALQLGYGFQKERRQSRPAVGHLKKAGVPATVRHLKEIRLGEDDAQYALEVGAEVKADLFEVGERVDVTATSKGKGFAGVIKRWGFHRGPMAHGSMYHRRVGSLGATGPARVFKGRKMPGRMGGRRTTIQSLKVVRVDPENNLLLVQGSVPGPKGTLVTVRESTKRPSSAAKAEA